jgi:hypothetical protein
MEMRRNLFVLLMWMDLIVFLGVRRGFEGGGYKNGNFFG